MRKTLLLSILMLAGCTAAPADNICSYTGTISDTDEHHIAVRVTDSTGDEYILEGDTSDLIIIRDTFTIPLSKLNKDEKVVVACRNGEITSIAVIDD